MFKVGFTSHEYVCVCVCVCVCVYFKMNESTKRFVFSINYFIPTRVSKNSNTTQKTRVGVK